MDTTLLPKRACRVILGVGPVVLSVPHSVINFPLRSFTSRRKGIVSRDMGSWPLVREMLALHDFPTVRNLIPRALLDPNKNPEDELSVAPLRDRSSAYQDSRLSACFLHYHGMIQSLLAHSEHQYAKKTLLIDVHTFSRQPPYAPQEGFDIILGSGNRRTVPHGEVDLDLADFLERQGFSVFLPEIFPIYETGEWYSGGYTVFYHAAYSRVNALQVEVSEQVARDEERRKKLANSLVVFSRSLERS